MVRKHFRSGMDFMVAQTSSGAPNPDWITFLQNRSAASGAAPVTRRLSSSSPTITSTSTSSFMPTPSSSFIRGPTSPSSSFRSLSVSPSSSSDDSYDNEPKVWRLWCWIPPMGGNGQSHVDAGYEMQVAHFKDYLRRSDINIYSTSGLKFTSILEYSPLMEYVALYECGDCENNKENFPINVTNSVRSYFIFKEGVRPLWEDEYNVAGGCWTMRLNSNASGVICPKNLWKMLIRVLTDEQMKPYLSDEICGVGLTIRRRPNMDKKAVDPQEILYKMTVWNRDANNTIVILMIGQLLKSLVTYSIDRLQYTAHSSTIHQNARKHQRNSNKNKNTKRKRHSDVANHTSSISPFSPRNFRI